LLAAAPGVLLVRPRPAVYYSLKALRVRRPARRRDVMRAKGAHGVGRFSVDIEVANNGDMELMYRGLLQPDKVRRETISALVDTGAAMLVLPQSVVKRLGLRLGKMINVRYAHGRRAQRQEAKGAYVELLGRDSTFDAVVEPRRQTGLVGAIVLEALDLLVDCQNQCVVPRDPSGPIYEIE
jgi:predicted aspartyl protease